jgi:hypothetical protein
VALLNKRLTSLGRRTLNDKKYFDWSDTLENICIVGFHAFRNKSTAGTKPILSEIHHIFGGIH